MTVTTPPTDPGGRPASDRWVTIFAACSVLCTVVALVCLGLLVFTGDDKGSGSATASSGTSGTSGASADDPSSPEESRPDNLTDAGWSDSNAKCLTGDPWVYAAEGSPGQVVICVNNGLLYPVTNESTGTPDPTQYQSLMTVCPASDDAEVTGRFTEGHMDIGWTEYDGLTRWDYDMYSGRGEPHLVDPENLSKTHYDGFWTRPDVDLSTLTGCQGARGSRTERFIAEYGEPSRT